MTVIVYKDGVLAADRMCSTAVDLINGYHTKIHSQDGMMWGSAGPAEDGYAFDAWVRANRPGEQPELRTGEDGFVGILIEADGVVRHYDGKLVPFPIESPYHAIGNGDMVAFGAMYMGATAEQAVLAACHHVLGCGGGVDVLRLDAQPSVEPPASAAAAPKPSMGTMGT
jgi:hypothetical protein